MKKRVLFVEDDLVLLRLYTMMMDDEGGRWDVVTASNGQEALALIKKEPFDIVVTDMQMPEMTGAELVREIRKTHPGISRVILSGVCDQEQVVRCMDTTHQFLAKPCNPKTLKGTLARLSSLDAYLQDDRLKTLVARLNTLPSFPSVYTEIMKELDREEPSLEMVAQIVAKDPGLTAKLLQIVNSVVFGLAHPVASPFEAIQHLGWRTVRSVLMSAHIFNCFDQTGRGEFSAARLLDHALRCGLLAQAIMQLEQAEPSDIEDAYFAGMLHDVGKLMLAHNLPLEFQKAMRLAAERHQPFHEAELEVFGATHAGAGAYLLGLWGLPAAIVEAVAFHHSPAHSDLRTFGPLAAVHAANVLEHEYGSNSPDAWLPKLDEEYFAALGLAERPAVWRKQAAKLLKPTED